MRAPRPALPLALALALAGCGWSAAALDPADAARRAAVEVAVKSAYPGILDEIAAGGGPALEAALDASGVPEGDRGARVTQLQGDLGLYRFNPGALSAAIVAYGR